MTNQGKWAKVKKEKILLDPVGILIFTKEVQFGFRPEITLCYLQATKFVEVFRAAMSK